MNLSTKNKVGLVIAALLGLLDIAAPFVLQTPEGEVGPPVGILVLSAIMGVITVIAVVIAWRSGSAGAIRTAAGARIVSALTSLPAFFVDVPAGIKVGSAVFVVVTIVVVVLMLTPARSTAPATEGPLP